MGHEKRNNAVIFFFCQQSSPYNGPCLSIPFSLFLAIFVEFCASLAYAVLSRIPWITQHPDHIFLLEFVRSQLATSLVLIVIFGPKV